MLERKIMTFAYGSNMLSSRIQERCPSATSLGVAILAGYRLCWHKRSKDGSGKCDIVESLASGDTVLGVLYEISEGEKPQLDRSEGLGHGYEQIEIEVLCMVGPIQTSAYKATDIESGAKPYSWYLALVVAGAKENGLSSAYVAQLEAVTAYEDPDRKRHNENMRLCGERLA